MADAPDLTLFHSEDLESRVKVIEQSLAASIDIKSKITVSNGAVIDTARCYGMVVQIVCSVPAYTTSGTTLFTITDSKYTPFVPFSAPTTRAELPGGLVNLDSAGVGRYYKDGSSYTAIQVTNLVYIRRG